MSGPVLIAEPEEGLWEITLNRPDRGNALDLTLTDALIGAVDQASAAGARLVVLRGAGAQFCTGFDLSGLEAMSDADLLLRFTRIELLLQKISAGAFMTMALAGGRVFGAGADLFTICDHRFIVGQAQFAFPGAGFGLVLGTRRLGARIGVDRALDLARSGCVIDSAEALRVGLASALVQPDGIGSAVAGALRAARRLDLVTATAIRGVFQGGENDDLAVLVRSAARPGLKERILAYRAGTRAGAGS